MGNGNNMLHYIARLFVAITLCATGITAKAFQWEDSFRTNAPLDWYESVIAMTTDDSGRLFVAVQRESDTTIIKMFTPTNNTWLTLTNSDTWDNPYGPSVASLAVVDNRYLIVGGYYGYAGPFPGSYTQAGSIGIFDVDRLEWTPFIEGGNYGLGSLDYEYGQVLSVAYHKSGSTTGSHDFTVVVGGEFIGLATTFTNLATYGPFRPNGASSLISSNAVWKNIGNQFTNVPIFTVNAREAVSVSGGTSTVTKTWIYAGGRAAPPVASPFQMRYANIGTSTNWTTAATFGLYDEFSFTVKGYSEHLYTSAVDKSNGDAIIGGYFTGIVTNGSNHFELRGGFYTTMGVVDGVAASDSVLSIKKFNNLVNLTTTGTNYAGTATTVAFLGTNAFSIGEFQPAPGSTKSDYPTLLWKSRTGNNWSTVTASGTPPDGSTHMATGEGSVYTYSSDGKLFRLIVN